MRKKIKDFRDLKIWIKGIDIVKKVYKLVKVFPQQEVYGLCSQMQRAAVSIPSNIAEGFNRGHDKEYKQFLYISLGSCAELETHLEIAWELNYINNENKRDLIVKLQQESKMISNLIKRLTSNQQPATISRGGNNE